MFGKVCMIVASRSKVTTLGWHTPTLACVQIGGQCTAARFFIDVRGVGGRVLTESVRCTAEACRCPSTPAPSSFSRRSQKHHTSLSKRTHCKSISCKWLRQAQPERRDLFSIALNKASVIGTRRPAQLNRSIRSSSYPPTAFHHLPALRRLSENRQKAGF